MNSNNFRYINVRSQEKYTINSYVIIILTRKNNIIYENRSAKKKCWRTCLQSNNLANTTISVTSVATTLEKVDNLCS